jgi:hypothetical protein
MISEAPLLHPFGIPETSAAWAHIPTELKDRNQWVVWKRKKVPYNPRNRQSASTKDPSTWSSFDEAVAAYKNSDFKGVGFVFTTDDPYFGVDLDQCRNPATGEIEPWAKSIVDSLDSYTDISQSGTGLHVIVKGQLLGKKHKKNITGGGAIEMYDRKRYFTMSGNRLEGTPETINDRNIELGTLYTKTFGEPGNRPQKSVPTETEDTAQADGPTFIPTKITRPVIENDDELLDKARSAANGENFKTLFDRGDLSAYNKDHSSADLALCRMLTFWVGDDADRIDRLFRRSALIRPKWDESRPGGTYGSITIAKALKAEGFGKSEKKPDSKAQKKTGLRPWQDIIDSETDDVGYIVDGMIEEGGTSLLIARQKAGKSMLAGQMCIDVSFGEPFLQALNTKKGPVIYLDFENRPQILKARGKDLGQNRKLRDVYYACYARISERDLGLDGENLERLKQAVADLKPVLLVIDPLRLATSTDTNDAQKVVQLLERTSDLLAVNPKMGILIVHHVKKNQQDKEKTLKLRADPREWMDKVHGSQALLAHVDIIIGFEQDVDDLFTLATVPRSASPITWALEKAPGSQRFVRAGNESQIKMWTKTQRDHWENLPAEFSRSQGEELMAHSTLDRIIRKAIAVGMLQQDSQTKRYKKVVIGETKFCGTSGISIDNKELITGTHSGTTLGRVGQLPIPAVPETSQRESQI